MLTIPCAICGKPVTKFPSRFSATKWVVCSHKCWGKLRYFLSTLNMLPPIMTSKYSPEYLLKVLQETASQLGHTPTCMEFYELTHIAPKTMFTYFGSWHKAIAAAGLAHRLPALPNWDISSLAKADGSWLSGLVDGEGCFRISACQRANTTHRPFFSMALRDDDVDVLHQVLNLWDLKTTIRHRLDRNASSPNRKPAASISVNDIPSLWLKVVPTFDKFPLRSKKQRDFLLFRRAVAIYAIKLLQGRHHDDLTLDERRELKSLYHTCEAVKTYQSNLEQLCQQYGLDINLLRCDLPNQAPPHAS